MQDTSLVAYSQVNCSPREQDVLEAIETLGMEATNLQISEWLGWPINRVTGRTNKLVEKEVLRDSGRRRIVEGKYPHIIWEVEVKYRKEKQMEGLL